MSINGWNNVISKQDVLWFLRFMDRSAGRVGSGHAFSMSGRVAKFGPACNSGHALQTIWVRKSFNLEMTLFDWSYKYLLALHGPILYHFRDKARYWSEIDIFKPNLQSTPPLGSPVRNPNSLTFGMEKLEWWAYQTVKSLRICLLVSTHYTNVTDGQTDKHRTTA